MSDSYEEITVRPNDKQRQSAHASGVGGYGGEDTDYEELRQKTLPSDED